MPILELLKQYKTTDDVENKMQADMIRFVEEHPDCFERSLLKGHVTGSAWIVNTSGTEVLLIHHVKLDKWMQPGGHCDGDANVLNVAGKEAWEETGLTVEPVLSAIFDIDNHLIPLRREVPAHIHYDIRFLFRAEKEADELPGNNEVNSIRWVRLEDTDQYNATESVMRMVRKTALFRQPVCLPRRT